MRPEAALYGYLIESSPCVVRLHPLLAPLPRRTLVLQASMTTTAQPWFILVTLISRGGFGCVRHLQLGTHLHDSTS